jgi:hypothetical protein
MRNINQFIEQDLIVTVDQHVFLYTKDPIIPLNQILP